MNETMQPIREWENVTPERFEEEVRPLGQPAVFRGLVRDFPLVQAGGRSASAAVDYLSALYSGKPIGTLSLSPAAKGRIFYNEEMRGYNFKRVEQELSGVLRRLLELGSHPNPPAVAIQAISAPEFLPDFDRQHPMPLGPKVGSKLWIGNAAIVAPHFDLLENIAWVAVGRRRFTLFPPEQLPNLYIGPLDNTPAGAPVSMVDINAPDFERFPRYSEALAAAQTAALGPGDVVYIPYMWWHGVQALSTFNILVNYWWHDEHRANEIHPIVALMVAKLAFGHLSAEQKERWRTMLSHYVFDNAEESMAHLPAHARGVMGELTDEQMRAVRRMLGNTIGQV